MKKKTFSRNPFSNFSKLKHVLAFSGFFSPDKSHGAGNSEQLTVSRIPKQTCRAASTRNCQIIFLISIIQFLAGVLIEFNAFSRFERRFHSS